MAGYKKQALSIGNDTYVRRPLKSCVNDAVDVTSRLRAIGFRTQCSTNLELSSMKSATDRFVQSIKPGSVALFYFSGHGLQYQGVNYLIPTNDKTLVEGQFDHSALNVQNLIDRMYSKNPRVMIVILDCCRGYKANGLPRQNQFHNGEQDQIMDGLAPMSGPPATIIAYACAADQVSSGLSKNNRNGLYTYHLLKHISTPNTDIDLILRRVARDVQNDPMNLLHQVPFRYSSCNEPIYLAFHKRMKEFSHIRNLQLSPTIRK